MKMMKVFPILKWFGKMLCEQFDRSFFQFHFFQRKKYSSIVGFVFYAVGNDVEYLGFFELEHPDWEICKYLDWFASMRAFPPRFTPLNYSG